MGAPARRGLRLPAIPIRRGRGRLLSSTHAGIPRPAGSRHLFRFVGPCAPRLRLSDSRARTWTDSRLGTAQNLQSLTKTGVSKRGIKADSLAMACARRSNADHGPHAGRRHRADAPRHWPQTAKPDPERLRFLAQSPNPPPSLVSVLPTSHIRQRHRARRRARMLRSGNWAGSLADLVAG